MKYTVRYRSHSREPPTLPVSSCYYPPNLVVSVHNDSEHRDDSNRLASVFSVRRWGRRNAKADITNVGRSTYTSYIARISSLLISDESSHCTKRARRGYILSDGPSLRKPSNGGLSPLSPKGCCGTPLVGGDALV